MRDIRRPHTSILLIDLMKDYVILDRSVVPAATPGHVVLIQDTQSFLS